MKIVNAGFEIMERDEERGGLAVIERAGRVCYKTEEKITPTSAETFVRGLITSGHHSVLEHGDMIFEVEDAHIYENLANALQTIRNCGARAPMLSMTDCAGRCVVSGNMRAWMELFGYGTLAARYFIGSIDPLYTKGFGFPQESFQPDPRVHPLKYADLKPGERAAHRRMTVRFTVDRGITHEFVRHRTMSFSQESTRYCNYSGGRFGSQITVVKPCYLAEGTEAYDVWKRQCEEAERVYFKLLEVGLLPQEARAVLPHSTKAELVMTGTLSAWNHFFALRARQTSGKAHPQAAEVAVPLREAARALYPEII